MVRSLVTRARKDRGISSVEYIIILVLVALTGIAVAANLTLVALSEETGVSIRNPAANNNIVSASDPSVAALFAELARTADNIPDALADAYSELFDDLYSSEIEMKMTWQMGIQWWPKNATAYVEKFISRASGGE